MADIKLTDDQIKALESMGGKRWTKNGMDRMYFNATDLGLDLEYYKSKNISNAELNGEHIPNAEARRMLSCKFYVDLTTGEACCKWNSRIVDEWAAQLESALNDILARATA